MTQANVLEYLVYAPHWTYPGGFENPETPGVWGNELHLVAAFASDLGRERYVSGEKRYARTNGRKFYSHVGGGSNWEL